MSRYLSDYNAFEPDETASLVTEFQRLALQEGWKKKSDIYKQERKAFYTEAVREEFLKAFGKNQRTLQAWRKLCVKVGVIPESEINTLGSITDCKNKLKGVFVNLVDLADACRAGEVMGKAGKKGVFDSHKGLSKYIRSTKKYFDKSEAKRNPLLQHFLIVVGRG